MTNNDRAREDIAFIRRAIEEGGAYATARSPDMLVWGVAVAIGYFGTWAYVRGWTPLAPRGLWAVCLGIPWIYSLRRLWRRLAGQIPLPRGPMAQALSMLWLGIGIFLTLLAVPVLWTGDDRGISAVVAGALGIGFFASAWLANLPWLRGVAILWWVGELALFALRRDSALLPLAAGLSLVLLAGPGAILMRRRGQQAAG